METVHVESREDFEERWAEAVAVLETSIARLRAEYGVVSSRFLPYPAILPAFAGAHSEAQKRPEAERMRAQRKLSYWYWASVFTQRYSSAVESTAAADYRDLGKWYRDEDNVSRVIGEFRISLRDLDLRPVRPGSAIYSSAIGKLLPETTEPPLQEELHRLEADMRQIELGLRGLIERALGDPAHPGLTNTLGYARKRIDQALRDDPSLDRQHLRTLAGQLEFCDLRELEAAIVSKPSWPAFRELFGTQDGLRHRFHALSAIRNALAHSRPVTRQNVADAEAAFLWFKSRIGRST